MRRGRVILYNPQAPHYQMPLGVLAVGSALAGAGHEVRILDGRFTGSPQRRLAGLLDDTLMAGVGVLSGSPISDAIRFSRQVKSENPDVPVVWGGWHPSLLPRQCLTESAVDLVMRGPGEEAAVTLARVLEEGASAVLDEEHSGLGEVPGLTARRPDGTCVDTDVRLPDRPPVLDYGLLDVEAYFSGRGSRTLDFVTSQGCPFGCAFCSDPAVYARRWRCLPAAEVVNRLTGLVQRHRLEAVSFLDDMFHLKPDRTAAIAEGLARLPASPRWSASFRASQLASMDEGFLSLLVRSGLHDVVVGGESGSDRILAAIAKDLTRDQIVRTARRLRDHGLRPTFSFIAGLPGETPADRQATEDLVFRIREIHPRAITRIFFYTPFPGSRLTAEMAAAGRPLPATLEDWARCDFYSSRRVGDIPPDEASRIDRINFYTHYAALFPRRLHPLRPLAALARRRCRNRDMRFPWEKMLLSFRPNPAE